MLRKVVYKYANRNKLNTLLFSNNNIHNVCNFPHTSLLYFTKNFQSANITYNNKHATAENLFQQENLTELSEKEFVVKIKDDPDNFGAASNDDPIDPDDEAEQKFLEDKPSKSQKLSTKQYSDIIKTFIHQRKIKEAIDTLEVRMLQEDRVKPENYIYNLVIGACGRVGYTKKAFSLYNHMKKRALNVTPGTYTALFNACANSPWPTTDGLTRAKHLRGIMIEKMYEPNATNYNSMIKAFGRGGDLATAFALVDEMAAKKFLIKDDTLNFLLQACISDKEAGFRHALLVWRKFMTKNIAPSTYTYNLMLRCIRDCGLGDIEATTDVINRLLPKSGQLLRSITDSKPKLIADKSTTKETAAQGLDEPVNLNDTKINFKQLNINKPNLMAKIPHLGNILSLSEVTKPEDRLLLVGGSSEFLQNMVSNGCRPDVKTFTQLLNSIPSTAAAEGDLLLALRKNNVKPDVDFFNMLIKKRSTRFDYESAKDVLTMLKTAGLRPNLITYGVLAIGCTTKEQAQSLLKEMSEVNYRINIEILGAMLTQACYHNNFSYVLHLMEMCINEEIKPSQKFLENLEEFRKKCKKISNDSDNHLASSSPFQKGYKIFKMRYKTWREQIQMEDGDTHPWQQYRQTSDTNVRHFRDKEATSRFKPVHTSLFRQKTSVKNIKK